jgi:ferric-dicitrate binding protein FerR (iron transport regulator)
MIAEDKYNALIVRHLDYDLSNEELNDLLDWLKADEQNFRYYLELKDIWYSGELLYSCEDVAEKALIRFREKYHLNEARRATSTKMIRIAWQIAATVLIACLLSLSWHWLNTDKGSATTPDKEFVHFLIPKGQKGQLTLNDGTRVWLNSNSILRYPTNFGNGSRKIVLDGEAYLEVAKDPAHPFILETSSVTLRVLGTRFNVKCYSKENTVETTLIEGSLEILPGHSGVRRMKKVTLKPNEKAIFLKPNNQISVAELDIPEKKENRPSRRIQKSPMSITQIESIISWKDNYLIFRDESFEQIANKMESWYGVEIRIEDEKLKNYRFTGKFIYNETIEQVMEVINRTTPLQYSLNKNILIIRSK